MDKSTLFKGAFLGLFAVIFGALGAHALKEVLLPEQLLSFETGVRYQMYHAILLIVLAVVIKNKNAKFLLATVNLIFWGVVLFSGSIYLLTLKNLINVDYLKFAGPITPIGGILMVAGWFLLILEGLKRK
ncbi:MAG: DUF423 domain-containing protein [Bacteroidetes bacterium]|nr:DUF423 domain-containing protein [Bacteroidota bacterium]